MTTQNNSLPKSTVQVFDKKITCKICSKNFASKKLLRKHILVHPGEIFLCEICDRTYTNPKSYILHKKTHTGVTIDKCPLCSCRFKSRGYLLKHLTICSHRRRWKCQKCDKAFTHRSTLNYHLKTHLARTKKRKENPEGNAANGLLPPKDSDTCLCATSCSCPKTLATTSGTFILVKPVHKDVSSSTYVNRCKFCDKNFSTKGNLVRHMKSHGQTNACTECGKQFESFKVLTDHLKTEHHHQASERCLICQKVFKQKHSLKLHMKFHNISWSKTKTTHENGNDIKHLGINGTLKIPKLCLKKVDENMKIEARFKLSKRAESKRSSSDVKCLQTNCSNLKLHQESMNKSHVNIFDVLSTTSESSDLAEPVSENSETSKAMKHFNFGKIDFKHVKQNDKNSAVKLKELNRNGINGLKLNTFNLSALKTKLSGTNSGHETMLKVKKSEKGSNIFEEMLKSSESQESGTKNKDNLKPNDDISIDKTTKIEKRLMSLENILGKIGKGKFKSNKTSSQTGHLHDKAEKAEVVAIDSNHGNQNPDGKSQLGRNLFDALLQDNCQTPEHTSQPIREQSQNEQNTRLENTQKDHGNNVENLNENKTENLDLCIETIPSVVLSEKRVATTCVQNDITSDLDSAKDISCTFIPEVNTSSAKLIKTPKPEETKTLSAINIINDNKVSAKHHTQRNLFDELFASRHIEDSRGIDGQLIDLTNSPTKVIKNIENQVVASEAVCLLPVMKSSGKENELQENCAKPSEISDDLGGEEMKATIENVILISPITNIEETKVIMISPINNAIPVTMETENSEENILGSCIPEESISLTELVSTEVKGNNEVDLCKMTSKDVIDQNNQTEVLNTEHVEGESKLTIMKVRQNSGAEISRKDDGKEAKTNDTVYVFNEDGSVSCKTLEGSSENEKKKSDGKALHVPEDSNTTCTLPKNLENKEKSTHTMESEASEMVDNRTECEKEETSDDINTCTETETELTQVPPKTNETILSKGSLDESPPSKDVEKNVVCDKDEETIADKDDHKETMISEESQETFTHDDDDERSSEIFEKNSVKENTRSTDVSDGTEELQTCLNSSDNGTVCRSQLGHIDSLDNCRSQTESLIDEDVPDSIINSEMEPKDNICLPKVSNNSSDIATTGKDEKRKGEISNKVKELRESVNEYSKKLNGIIADKNQNNLLNKESPAPIKIYTKKKNGIISEKGKVSSRPNRAGDIRSNTFDSGAANGPVSLNKDGHTKHSPNERKIRLVGKKLYLVRSGQTVSSVRRNSENMSQSAFKRLEQNIETFNRNLNGDENEKLRRLGAKDSEIRSSLPSSRHFTTDRKNVVQSPVKPIRTRSSYKFKVKETIFFCEVCDKSFKTKSSLRTHKFSHRQQYNFVCQACGMGFFWEDHLERHMNVHLKTSSYIDLLQNYIQ